MSIKVSKRIQRHVAPLNLPLVFVLEQQSADQAGDDRLVREDADHIRAMRDFAVWRVLCIGCVQLGTMLAQEFEVGKEIPREW